MKIFISHSSKNKDIGNCFVKLLRGIGISENEIIFTSNKAYGIPVGQNIFNWLKSQIIEKPFVIYLLSNEYYKSVACLNEMGAAWIIENEHLAIFTQDFKIESMEFQNGAIDPRELGCFVDDEEGMHSLIQVLSKHFKTSESRILINQQVKEFISCVAAYKDKPKATTESRNAMHKAESETKIDFFDSLTELSEAYKEEKRNAEVLRKQNKPSNIFQIFCDSLKNGKLSDEEIILIYYVIENSRYKLKIGWQMDDEIRNIRDWEEVNEIQNLLSNKYESVTRKLQLRNFVFVSAETSSGNPKEIQFWEDIAENFLNFPDVLMEIIKNTVAKYDAN